MVLANSRFEIDVTEQRPRPLIPTPHPPPPPKRKTTESHHDSAGQRLFQRPARSQKGRTPDLRTFVNEGQESAQLRHTERDPQCPLHVDLRHLLDVSIAQVPVIP